MGISTRQLQLFSALKQVFFPWVLSLPSSFSTKSPKSEGTIKPPFVCVYIKPTVQHYNHHSICPRALLLVKKSNLSHLHPETIRNTSAHKPRHQELWHRHHHRNQSENSLWYSSQSKGSTLDRWTQNRRVSTQSSSLGPVFPINLRVFLNLHKAILHLLPFLRTGLVITD